MNLSLSGRKIAIDELLKDCDSFRKGDSPDSEKSDDHHVIDVEALHLKPVPFVLAFNNLEYDVILGRRFGFSRRSGVKTLLDDVSGEACDGDILAVLGASGAGKSTLIDALAGRVAQGSLKGSKTIFTEFALDLVRELEGSNEGTRSLVDFNEKWQQNKLSFSQSAPQTNKFELDSPLTLKEAINASVSRGKLVSGSSRANLVSMETVSSYANPSLFETFILAKRYMKNWMRMPELVGTRIATVMVTGFLLATVYWKLDHTPRGALERLTLFAFVVPTMFYCCLDNVPVFIQERYIFLRKTTHNAYRTSSYVISHSLVTLPQLIAPSLVFSAITFWTVGLSGGLEGFYFYCLIIYASFWSGSSVVTFISGVVPNIMLSYMVAISYLAYCLLLSGFYVNRDRIPVYWTWFHYISLLKYPYEAVIINEFDDPSRCFVKGVQVFDSTLLGGVSDSGKVKLLETLGKSLNTRITESTCLRTGSDLLAQQGITELSKWECLWITFASGLFFRILFYFALLFGGRNKRT
ncbi:PREDICTED: ABC transporter G family member 19-like [Camelina sativa]|uniref:ABC transporter G family member 19-like n=1 Tax=Camelina sativa TaxID=90675 RepID=A0ABM0TTY3_CAMSA|nr:PREDICTED: ABC transporter G family member 19-like [Camelina sativa]